MKNILSTQAPRAAFKFGQRVHKHMGVKLNGTVCGICDLPDSVLQDIWRRTTPKQPLIPVKWDDGTFDAIPRQFIQKI